MSSIDSMPIDSRTISGSTPAARCSSSDNWRCVVEAGWMTSDLASPMFARCERNCRLSMNYAPAPAPPAMPTVNTLDAPGLPSIARKYLHAMP